MAWGIMLAPRSGRFSPSRNWVGWKEKRTRFLYEELSELEKQALNPENMLNDYLANVSSKFSRDKGLVLDHEWPVEFRTERVQKN